MKTLTMSLALLGALATGAQAFHTRERHPVNPITPTEFEVIDRIGSKFEDIWCAAGTYARDQLGVKRGRIYLAEPRGPSRTAQGRKGIVFSIEPVAGKGSRFGLSVTRPGTNISVSMADSHCFHPFDPPIF